MPYFATYSRTDIVATSVSGWVVIAALQRFHPRRKQPWYVPTEQTSRCANKLIHRTGVLISPEPDLLPDVFCLMVRIFRLMLVLFTHTHTHTHTHICMCVCIYIYIYIYRCPRRNVPDFGRVFLMLKHTDITQNTYVQIWTVTEITAREVSNFDSCYTLIDYQIHIKTGRNMWFL